MTERTDDSLAGAAAAALAASAQRVVVFEHGGGRFVAKRVAERPRRVSQALFLRWLVKRATGQVLPMRTLLLSEASNAGYEARRLQALAAAGVRVPRLRYHDASYLLLEHCGPTVATQLEGWSADTFGPVFERLAQELGAFHRAGQWHGAAQIKNLTTLNGQTYRIDFEENFGELVPLPASQALDLVLFMNSIALAGPVVEAQARALLPRLLDAYFAAHPEPRVREAMLRALPWLNRLARVASPFGGQTRNGRQRKGAARLVLLAEVLRAWLERATPGSTA